MAYRYLSVECAIRKSSLHLQRVMLCEPEMCHAWTGVYDSICGDSNLASLTSCSANFVVTALKRTVHTVTSYLSTVALRPQKHSSKITSRLHIEQLSPYLSNTTRWSAGARRSELVCLHWKLNIFGNASGVHWMERPVDSWAILDIVAKRKLTTFSTEVEFL